MAGGADTADGAAAAGGAAGRRGGAGGGGGPSGGGPGGGRRTGQRELQVPQPDRGGAGRAVVVVRGGRVPVRQPVQPAPQGRGGRAVGVPGRGRVGPAAGVGGGHARPARSTGTATGSMT